MATIIEGRTLGYNSTTGKAAFGNGQDTFDALPRAFGIESAPNDGYMYARKLGEWVRLVVREPVEG